MTDRAAAKGRAGIAALGLCALLATGCSRESERVPDHSAAADSQETPSVTPVDTPPPPETPTLGAIAQIDIEAELEPGPNVGRDCSLIQDGRNLLAAVDSDAIAKPYGTIRHFAFAGDETGFADGGRFAAGAITIEIAPTEKGEEQVGEISYRPVAVTVREQGVETPDRFAAEWHCGE